MNFGFSRAKRSGNSEGDESVEEASKRARLAEEKNNEGTPVTLNGSGPVKSISS